MTQQAITSDMLMLLGTGKPDEDGVKRPVKTTGIIMDAEHLDILKSVVHLRVLRGEAPRASVSDITREAVAEFIERHKLRELVEQNSKAVQN